MSEILDQQLALHDAASICDLGLLRPATLRNGEALQIFGEELDRERLLEHLAPALDLAWPDRPRDPDDLEAFLREAYTKVVVHSRRLAGEEGFVPAALWTDHGRELLLEHLREDVEALIGGVRAEGLWFAFGELGDTAALGELIHTGMLIKLRALGAFLVLKPSRHDDELTAAEFFQAGSWEEARDGGLSRNVVANQKLVHKQIAHLTITRPLPEDRNIYRPSSYLHVVDEQLQLLEQFSNAVDLRLLPDWWSKWVAGLRERLFPE